MNVNSCGLLFSSEIKNFFNLPFLKNEIRELLFDLNFLHDLDFFGINEIF